MPGETKTQGTEMWVASGGSAIPKLGNVTSISGLGGSSNDIDITNFDSSQMEYLQSLGDGGTLTVNYNFSPTTASTQTIIDLKESRATVEWCIGLSNGTTLPTAAAGVITAPAYPRSSIVFSGVVQGHTLDLQANDVVRATLTIRISGQEVYNLESGSPSA